MTTQTETDDDSYIIILGSSPGASMDVEKCNGTLKGEPLDKSQIEDAMKDLSVEANMAFKAQFSLADSVSINIFESCEKIVYESNNIHNNKILNSV